MPNASASPALVVVVTIDQLTPRYLERWRSQFTGGLARLLNEGAVFTNAYHDHAITETAPGHAAILSGRFPYSTGIAMNYAGVNNDDSPLIDAADVGASPSRFRGTTLADWMTSANSDSRVLSVSRKDRGAILPIGRAKHSVFWYAMSNGSFTTSSWYADTVPSWVRAFNAEGAVMNRYAGKKWELLLPDSAYAEPDTVVGESFGQDFVFPYVMPSDTLRATNLLVAFPFMDELTLEFAWRGVTSMQLGQRTAPDLLAVSLSTTDAVGHRWGPESREMHDHLLRVDRMLGAFFDSLLTVVPADRLVIALTSDHGVAPSPDMRSSVVNNTSSQRVMLDDFQPAITASAIRASQARFPLEALDFDGFTLSVNRSIVKGRERDIRNIATAFAKEARTIKGVLRVDLMDDLAKADTVTDAIARRWLHMFRPGGEVVATVTLNEFNIFGRSNVATHGSPHDYDAHVPLLLWGAPFAAMRDSSFVRVVDIAPTLANVLGVRVTERVDGRVLTKALRNTPQ
jgi:predicted AlkP superfamily pyrophosphatase or phosphodiesterase